MAKKNQSDAPKKPIVQGTSINSMSTGGAMDDLTESALGQWIIENKGLAIGIVAFILSSVLAYGGWTMYQADRAEKASEAVYAFENDVLNPFMQDQISYEDVVREWRSLNQEFSGQKALLPVLLFISDELIESGELDIVNDLLTSHRGDFSGDFARYFIDMRLAVVQEDLGLINEAIATLERMESSSLDLLETKVYLDLGRLYMQTGEYQKARLSFEHVTSQMSQEEFAQMARIYLAELDGREDQAKSVTQ